MIWTALPLALALAADPSATKQADPYYAGGAAPQAISKTQHLRTSPSEFACSIDTMIKGQACVFDAEGPTRAVPVDAAAQGRENQKAAGQVVRQACQQHAQKTPLSQGANARPQVQLACEKSMARYAVDCSLDGVEALLDAKGRFSTKAQQCYFDMATALQKLTTADAMDTVRREGLDDSSPKDEKAKHSLSL
jgi:hypothetical protein